MNDKREVHARGKSIGRSWRSDLQRTLCGRDVCPPEKRATATKAPSEQDMLPISDYPAKVTCMRCRDFMKSKSKRDLKVFGVRYRHHSLPKGEGRVIIATTSLHRMAKVVGIPHFEAQNYGAITSDEYEIAQGLARPGVVLISSSFLARAKQDFVPLSALFAMDAARILGSE